MTSSAEERRVTRWEIGAAPGPCEACHGGTAVSTVLRRWLWCWGFGEWPLC